ncbi:MAG: hypothetical protein ACI4JJ_03005 [Huintestinicola sp.]
MIFFSAVLTACGRQESYRPIESMPPAETVTTTENTYTGTTVEFYHFEPDITTSETTKIPLIFGAPDIPEADIPVDDTGLGGALDIPQADTAPYSLTEQTYYETSVTSAEYSSGAETVSEVSESSAETSETTTRQSETVVTGDTADSGRIYTVSADKADR